MDHNGYALRLCSCCETTQSIVAQEGLTSFHYL
uniref:Zona-pellucida-binding protein n=1 Tax=Podoviridae sp. ct8Lf7 TaxID=2827723 RepID=A0A8S5S1E7_9CAUD|nr:MAG TPA: zona-pellucida-binding protein [Podoviridae sp. ct8Lf7]